MEFMLNDGAHIVGCADAEWQGRQHHYPNGIGIESFYFFFDVKEELWQATAGYRQKVLGQKVMKFAPLVGGGGDLAFWGNSAAALITGVIMHLMYKHHQENLRLPCPTDIMSFLSSPDMKLEGLFTYMKNYPHISPEKFLELPDKNGNPRVNPLKEIYGEYVQDLRPFARIFKGKKIKNLEDVRRETLELMQKEEIDWEGDEDENPFHILLTHPKVAECAANMLDGAEQTRASIM